MVNKQNLLFKVIEGDLNKLEAKNIFDCAKDGDEFSKDLVDYEAEWIACGLGSILNIINPSISSGRRDDAKWKVLYGND